MASSTTTTLAELIPSEIIQEARFAFQSAGIVRPGFCRIADISGVPGKVASFPVYTAATVTKTAAEDTDLTTTNTLDPTEVELTVARRAVRADITDLARASAVRDINMDAGMILGRARAKQVDTDVLAVIGTTHTSSVGATNSTSITPANLMSALLVLEVNEANDGILNLVLHPKQWNHLRDDLVFDTDIATDRSTQGQEAMNTGRVGRIFGANVYVTPRVSTGTDTNAMYLGMLFNAECIGYAVKNIGGNGGLEIQRDSSAALNELVLNYYDSANILRTSGVVLIKSQTY